MVNHYLKYCHVRKKGLNNIHTIQEATTMGNIARSMLKISATLENREVDHRASIAEIKGMLKDKPISILIDLGTSLSYVLPRIVELYKLQEDKFENSWLVQLVTGIKRKVTSFVKKCDFIMNGLKTHVDLNILPLGSYD